MDGIKVLFVTGFGPIVSDDASHRLYADTLGIAFEESEGYLHTEHLDGAKTFALWPLSQAAESCFGAKEWPAHLPVPHAWLEFDIEAATATLQTPGLRAPGYSEARTLGPDRNPPPQPRRNPASHSPNPLHARAGEGRLDTTPD